MAISKTAAIILILLIIGAVTVSYVLIKPGTEEEKALIITTFPGLEKDLQIMLDGCNISVEPLVPAGVDPHEYQLKPSDYQKLNKALLIISTGHTPFENEIKNTINEKDKIIVIPEIPGIKFKTLPDGAVNLHMPIYDPSNYETYITYIANYLSEKIPSCSETIRRNTAEIIETINNTYISHKDLLANRSAVLVSPAVEYAVSWLGVDIKGYLTLEHESSTSPEQITLIREELAKGAIAVIIVDNNSMPLGQSSIKLEQLAEEYNASIIKVPAPFLDTSMLEKIQSVANQALEITKSS